MVRAAELDALMRVLVDKAVEPGSAVAGPLPGLLQHQTPA